MKLFAHCKFPAINRRLLTKTLLIMKITVILLVAALQVNAEGFAQRITLNEKNAPLEKIFVEIKNQTGYTFAYTETLLKKAKKLTVELNDLRLDDALDICFNDQPFTYAIIEKTIVVKPRQTNIEDVEVIPLLPPVEVNGTVTDAEGKLIPGVSVLVKKTQKGTTTDNNGNFSIEADKGNALVFSFVGYEPVEISVSNNEPLKIVLKLKENKTEEVVVVGYGKQKKVNLTGAVGVIKSDYIQDRPITSASQALQGGTSGVFVNQGSGVPGQDAASIRIRGIGTLNNTNPLILVDGIESSLNNLDPNDIESMSVLKDAASSAIYGSRASNGVILVTTKRGKLNAAPSVSYSGYIGTSKATRLAEMVTNTAEFMQLANEANAATGATIPLFNSDDIARYTKLAPNTDWEKVMFRNAGVQQHNATVTGGSSNTTYLLSFGTLSQDAITDNTKFNRYNIRLNLDSKIANKLKVGTSLLLTRGNSNSFLSDIVAPGGSDGIIAHIIQAPPLYPAYDAQGRLAGLDQSLSNKRWLGNPLVPSTFNSFESAADQFLGNAFAEYEIIRGLTVKGLLGLNYNSYNSSSFASKGDVYDWVSGLPMVPSVNASRGRSRSFNNSNDLTTLVQANYDKKIKKHQFTLVAGFNQEHYKYGGFGADRIGFSSNSVQVLNAGNPLTSTNGESATEWALRSYFGRFNYNFDEKYLFEFNVRRDGSSRFGTNNRYGTFPSVSAGWIISKEPFFKTIKSVDLFKIRGSWGQLGNQYAGTGYPYSDYPYLAQVSLNTNYVFNNTLAPGAAQATYPNPDLKWETTTMTDLGIEVGLHKLTIEADYFVRTTKDILFALPVPATAGGLPNPTVNTAKVQNKGWEVSAKYKETFGPFNFNVGFNVTHLTSKLLYIDPSVAADKDEIITGVNSDGILRRGEALNSLYGLKAIGIFQNEEEIAKSPVQSGDYAPGDLKFADIDNNGVIDSRDNVIIGHEDPRWLFAGTLSLAAKGFDLSAIVQGVGDFQSYSRLEYYTPFYNGSGVGTQWRNGWKPDHHTDFPRLYLSLGPSTNLTNSFWVQNRSFVRLKNLQLGYTLPNSLLKKAGIQKMRFYINGQNLVTITKFQGFDPEKLEGSSRGGDSYPLLKIYTAGLNLTF